MLKKLVAILALIGTVGVHCAFAQSTCERPTWTPEVRALFGNKAAVVTNAKALETDLPSRRVFVAVVEDEHGIEVALYEKNSTGTFKVSKWNGVTGVDVHAKLQNAILANHAKRCVGQVAKEFLREQLGNPTEIGDVHPSAVAQPFAEAVGRLKADFIKATYFLLC